jgi:hypothetical protein
MKQSTLMIVLTGIIILIASFGKYVEVNITESATNIVEKRLNPAPLLSHRFDYFGTTLKENFTSQRVNFKQLKKNRSEILNVRRETSKMWEDYKLIASESEKDVVDRVDANMQEVDQMVDMLIELADRDPNYVDSIVKNGILFNKINPILEDINYLTDLQTEKGTEQTNIMLKLLSMFSSFMIGALALAIIMLGSVVYPMLKKEPEPKRKGRAPAKKPVAKKPAVKKPTTRKPVSKK